MADNTSRLIMLTYKAPEQKTPKAVYIMGSWDNMTKQVMSPLPEGAGIWAYSKFLLPGTYYFYFEVDGVLTHDTTQSIVHLGYFAKWNPWAFTYNKVVVGEAKSLLLKHAVTGRTAEFAYELSAGMDENWKKAKERLSITEPGTFGLKDGAPISSPAQLDHIRKVYFTPNNPTQASVDSVKNLSPSPSSSPSPSPSTSSSSSTSSSLASPIQRLYHIIGSDSEQALHTADSLEDAQEWVDANFKGVQLFIRAEPPETLKTIRTVIGSNRCCTVDFHQIGATRSQQLNMLLDTGASRTSFPASKLLPKNSQPYPKMEFSTATGKAYFQLAKYGVAPVHNPHMVYQTDLVVVILPEGCDPLLGMDYLHDRRLKKKKGSPFKITE